MAGFGDLDVMQRGRRLVVGVVMLLLGGVVGYALPKSDASPRSETGEVVGVGNATTDAGLRFTFNPDKGQTQKFLLQEATPWQGTRSGHWHYKGLAPCLVPGSTIPAKVTIGVVTAGAVDSAPDRHIVVWVECFT